MEEYSLKFIRLSKYAPPFVSNPKDEMSRFVTRVTNLVREECRMSMLHDDIILARRMVYAQSIEEPKHKRMSRSLKRCGHSDKDQPRL